MRMHLAVFARLRELFAALETHIPYQGNAKTETL